MRVTSAVLEACRLVERAALFLIAGVVNIYRDAVDPRARLAKHIELVFFRQCQPILSSFDFKPQFQSPFWWPPKKQPRIRPVSRIPGIRADRYQSVAKVHQAGAGNG